MAAGLDGEDEEDLAFWDITNGSKYARLDDDLTRTAGEAQITDGNELLLQKPVRQTACSAFEHLMPSALAVVERCIRC